MNAQIITIGDELLIGQVVDTNSAYMASQLTAINFKIRQILSVSDNSEAIKTAVTESTKQTELTVISGGLGPTKDDITKKALCELFNTSLIFSDEVFENVELFLKKRRVKMNVLNRQQALVPKDAQILTNRQGTAPGLWFEKDGRVVICLPGVPFEMKGIFEQEVIPALKNFFKLPVIIYKTYLLTGIPESQLAVLLADWEDNLPDHFSLAYLPSPGLLKLRVGLSGENRINLEKQLNEQEAILVPLITDFLFGFDKDTLASVVGEILKSHKLTMATAESCTGGNIAHQITLTPGSSEWYMGSVVAYSNQVKTSLLEVAPELIEKNGAVSSQVAEAMALGIQKQTGADFTVATTGIAGPDGGTPDKPVGTIWIAVATPNKILSKKFTFGNEREINISRFSMAALNLLRVELLNYFN